MDTESNQRHRVCGYAVKSKAQSLWIRSGYAVDMQSNQRHRGCGYAVATQWIRSTIKGIEFVDTQWIRSQMKGIEFLDTQWLRSG